MFFSALPPFSPPALRLFSPLCCLSGAVSALRRWRRRRHESHRQDRRRCPGLLWLFCDGALFRCSLDLNKKGRFLLGLRLRPPPAASGRLRSPPATSGHLPPRTTGLRPPCGGRSALGELWGCLSWLGRAHLGEMRARCIFFCLLGGGDLDLSRGGATEGSHWATAKGGGVAAHGSRSTCHLRRRPTPS